MGVYLTQDCLAATNAQTLFVKPYSQAINNLKMTFSSAVYANELNKNLNKKSLYSAPLALRIKHFFAGVALMIPVINICALLILRSSDLHTQRSASKIQAMFRGHKVRKAFKRQKAAIQIQAAFRGFKTKKAFEKKKQAALLIQSTFRGRKDRQTYLKKKEAAVAIQAAFRGWRTRNQLAKKPVEIERETALVVRRDVTVAKQPTLLQKAQKLTFRPEVREFVLNKAKVDVYSAAASLDNAKCSAVALCHGKFKISAYLAGMAVCHAFNASCRLLNPAGSGELNMGVNHALGGRLKIKQ